MNIEDIALKEEEELHFKKFELERKIDLHKRLTATLEDQVEVINGSLSDIYNKRVWTREIAKMGKQEWAGRKALSYKKDAQDYPNTYTGKRLREMHDDYERVLGGMFDSDTFCELLNFNPPDYKSWKVESKEDKE